MRVQYVCSANIAKDYLLSQNINTIIITFFLSLNIFKAKFQMWLHTILDHIVIFFPFIFPIVWANVWIIHLFSLFVLYNKKNILE